MKVYFENVGAHNLSWAAECKELDYDWFYNQVKRKGNVMSRDLDFLLNKEDQSSGIIMAGFHTIGTFKVER